MRFFPVRVLAAPFVLLICQGSLNGQKAVVPNVKAGATPGDIYAGESFVIERLDMAYVMNADGTGYRDKTVVVKVQSDAAVRQIGVIAVAFASASEHVEIAYARVRRADGTVTETPVSGAIEQPEQVTVQAPFYSDLKEEQLPVKNLRVGDTLEWKERVVRTKSEAAGQFWGEDSFVTDGSVVLESSIELRVPVTTTVTVWTNPTLGAQAQETVSGDQKVYRWEHANLKPTTGKDADAAKLVEKKRVLTAEELKSENDGKLPSMAWTTFKSWEAVGAWYRGLEDERAVPDAAVKAKVAELTAGQTTEEDKVRAVYAYVSAQVRYIGVAFGVGRYQPHHASDVMDNQYGDCKDKHTLLAAMLTALGLHPDAVLIGAGIRFNEAVPSPSAFNHLITRVQVNGQEVWLDSTAEVAPYRMLFAVIRDKQALVVPDTGAAMVVRTPEAPPFATYAKWKAVGTLDKEGVSESHITLEFRGDGELLMRQAVRQVAPAQYDDFMQRLVQGLGYQGTTSHADISRPEDTTEPLRLAFDYHREQGGDWEDRKLVAQLAPVVLPSVKEKEPPVRPIDLDTPRTESSTAEMKLPQGWGVELPEAVHEKTAFATYDLSYRFEKGTLYVDRRIVILQRRVPVDQWKVYKKWQDAIDLGNEAFVQMTHTGNKGVAPEDKNISRADAAAIASITANQEAHNEQAVERVSNAEAASLIQQAIRLIKASDLDAAEGLLDKAKKINPEQKELWGNYGYLNWQRHDLQTALTDYRKELELHPETTWVYGPIYRIVVRSGDKAAAGQTLQKWLDADPRDPEPVRDLMSLLVSEGKAAEAVQVGKTALDTLPEAQRGEQRFQLQYGIAEMRAGMDKDGAATLVAVMSTTDDPEMINSSAYELAVGNKLLILAETRERVALEKLTANSQSWSPEQGPGAPKQQSGLVTAVWDTMGWILFREGKVREAEPYVEASWLNAQRDDVHEHLVEIRLALAKIGATAKGADWDSEPQGLRTISLGPAQGRDGVAEYRLLLSHDRVERAVPAGDKTLPRVNELFDKVRLPRYFPAGSQVKLVRGAMVNCHSGECELMFVP